jgi:hypothetical protein
LEIEETRMNDGKERPHSYLQVYIDDVIIVTASQETHVRCWEHFIKVLEYERLAMTEPKIELGVKYLRYLGHIISHTEVFSDPKKVEAIHEMPAPQTKKDVRCWLGMCNYYRPYICNYGKMAKPLTEPDPRQSEPGYQDQRGSAGLLGSGPKPCSQQAREWSQRQTQCSLSHCPGNQPKRLSTPGRRWLPPAPACGRKPLTGVPFSSRMRLAAPGSFVDFADRH